MTIPTAMELAHLAGPTIGSIIDGQKQVITRQSAELATLRAQRDELVAALERALDLIVSRDLDGDEADQARAALAKVKQ